MRNRGLAVVLLILLVSLLLRKTSIEVSSFPRARAIGSIQKKMRSQVHLSATPTPTHPQSSPLALKKNSLDSEQTELVCALLRTGLRISPDEEVQIVAHRDSPVVGEPIGTNHEGSVWIKHKNRCALGSHDVYRLSANDQIEKEIPCENLNDVVLNSGEQGNVRELKDESPLELNVAISGPGYIYVRCENGLEILTRDGHFKRSEDGYLVNRDGCYAIGSNRETFLAKDEEIDSSGCYQDGSCLAIIDPISDHVGPTNYRNQYSLESDDVDRDRGFIEKGYSEMTPFLIPHALEDLHEKERWLTSVDWSDKPTLRISDLNCK